MSNSGRIVAWSDAADDLEGAKTLRVKKQVYSLKPCSTDNSVLVVHSDGSVALIEPTSLTPLANADANLGSAAKVRGAWCVPLGQGGVRTESVVLVLAERAVAKKASRNRARSGSAASRGSAGAGGASGPLQLCVFHATPGGGSGSGSGPSLELIATHDIAVSDDAEAGGSGSIEVVSAAYLPEVRSLFVAWSTGAVRTFSFPTMPRWYARTPSAGPARVLTCVSSATRCCAIGRSCVVLSRCIDSSETDASGGGAKGKRRRRGSISKTKDAAKRSVQLLVWDANYGVKVAEHVLECAVPGDAGADAVANISASPDGRFLSVEAAVGTSVCSVVCRAGTLSSVLGAMGNTQALFAEADPARPGVPELSAMIDIKRCIEAFGGAETDLTGKGTAKSTSRGATTKGKRRGRARSSSAASAQSASSDGATSGRDAWRDAAASTEREQASALAVLLDRKVTSTAAEFEAAFLEFMVGAGVDAIEAAAASGTTAAAAKPSKRKRSRSRTSSVGHGGDTELSSRDPSQAEVSALVARCLEDCDLGLWSPLRRLLRTRRVSASANPELLPVLIREGQIELLEECLRCVSDISEADLVGILRFVTCRANVDDLRDFVRGKFRRSHEQPHAPTSDDTICAAAVEHFVALLVRAPRNDVFMQRALRKLSAPEVVVLLTVLNRLLHKYAEHFLDVPSIARGGAGGAEKQKSKRGRSKSSSGEGDAEAGTGMEVLWHGATPKTKVPALGQVIDWARMLIDAHFSQLVLLAKGDAQLRDRVMELQTLVAEEVGLCEAVSGLRGQLAHVLNKEPLPVAPVPGYSIDVLDI